ncbi:molybdenum cofactor guanylyltransferase MobA [Pararhodobacter oceanensis]|uniref:molybdenum cofactor guanylyltransferase MobA n=1 Tax=Pararhodobacter oceanensis TaxID=2172121 RepID=UPI003A900CAA
MSLSPQITGVILAGGRATRMGGGDKGALLLGGQPMLAHVIARVQPQVDALALNANGDPARFAAYGLTVLPDPIQGHLGPLAGVLAAMDYAATLGAPRVLTVAADTPFLPRDLVDRLGEGLAVAASPDPEGRIRAHPTAALWPVSLAPDLRQALEEGERRVGRFADQMGARRCLFREQPDPFFNVNTPEDLALAEARL